MDRRTILMTHFTSPTNFGLIEDPKLYQKILHSPACSDEITIQIDSENQVFKSIKFIGNACVIATSAADIFATMLVGLTFDQATSLIKRFQTMIEQGTAAEPDFDELAIFDNIHRQKGRWKCATLASEGILDYLNTKSL